MACHNGCISTSSSMNSLSHMGGLTDPISQFSGKLRFQFGLSIQVKRNLFSRSAPLLVSRHSCGNVVKRNDISNISKYVRETSEGAGTPKRNVGGNFVIAMQQGKVNW